MIGTRIAASAVASTLALAACSTGVAPGDSVGGQGIAVGEPNGPAPISESESGAPIPDAGTPVPDDAPDSTTAGNAQALAFTGVDLDGTPVDAQTYAGGDVVLWMWAPW